MRAKDWRGSLKLHLAKPMLGRTFNAQAARLLDVLTDDGVVADEPHNDAAPA